jgi:hypothetical protein
MKPLILILATIALGIVISFRITEEATWFTYYSGALGGMFVSGIGLDIWNRRRRKIEEAQDEIGTRLVDV